MINLRFFRSTPHSIPASAISDQMGRQAGNHRSPLAIASPFTSIPGNNSEENSSFVSETNELQRNISVKDRYDSIPFLWNLAPKRGWARVSNLWRVRMKSAKKPRRSSGIPCPLSRMDAILWALSRLVLTLAGEFRKEVFSSGVLATRRSQSATGTPPSAIA